MKKSVCTKSKFELGAELSLGFHHRQVGLEQTVLSGLFQAQQSAVLLRFVLKKIPFLRIEFDFKNICRIKNLLNLEKKMIRSKTVLKTTHALKQYE